ncbi:GNAT family N-acetyltransferase [Eubacteriales bacterium OttesenSCG-928-N14]|nr:GNAT family N-acetyltransferase [Eubacteriales bacterium OttesenSCG-928-N14]
MPTTIRLAQVQDAPSIQQINRICFDYDDLSLQQVECLVAAIVQKGQNRIFVAEADGEVVGYAHAADYTTTYRADMKNIISIAVLPQRQKTGAGKLLLLAVEDWARQEGCCGVRLVSGHNRQDAHDFYEHMGYHNRKEQKNFIKLF